MSNRYSTLLLITSNLLIPVAVLVFATGFFPYKAFIPGLASYADGLSSDKRAPAPFDKIIFMVVDALRRLGSPPLRVCIGIDNGIGSDFVYSYDTGFEFTQR